MKRHRVEFTRHARLRLEQRGIPEEQVKSLLEDLDSSLYSESQNGKEKYIFNLSHKYKLVVIVKRKADRIIVITAYKTSKKLEKLISKRRSPKQLLKKVKTKKSGKKNNRVEIV